MTFIFQFCSRTFSNRSGLKQHINFCVPSETGQSSSEESNDMSLENEGFFEVKINKIMFLKF
jgi:hypothetical protein